MPERRKLSPTRPRASRRIANLLRLAGLRKHREAVAVVISREDVSTPAPEGDRRAVSVETEPVSLYRRRALVAKREAEPIADEADDLDDAVIDDDEELEDGDYEEDDDGGDDDPEAALP